MTNALLSRRHALGLVAGTFVLASCGRTSGRPVLKVGSQKGGTKSLMLSAGALDGATYDVEWSEFPAAQNLLEAIGSGAIDVGLAGDAPFQFAYQSGSPIKAVSAQRAEPRPYQSVALIVHARSQAKTVADLRGKRVATTRGSIGHYLALRALDVARLPFDAVQFIFLSPGDAKAAFSSGSVDAWSVWVPYLTAAIRDGARIIADGHDLTPGYGFEVANEQAIATKRSQLTDFLHREASALQWSASHQSAYARVLATETGLPIDIAAIVVEKNQRVVVPIDDDVKRAQTIVLDVFKRSGATAGSRSLAEAFAPLV